MVAMHSQTVTVPRNRAVPSDAGVAASALTTELGFASTLVLLSDFKHQMAYDGAAVDTQRMLTDSAYAFAQLALGHTSTSERLRQCAMRVFAVFHG